MHAVNKIRVALLISIKIEVIIKNFNRNGCSSEIEYLCMAYAKPRISNPTMPQRLILQLHPLKGVLVNVYKAKRIRKKGNLVKTHL